MSDRGPLAHLATAGVQVSLGSFLVHVHSDLPLVHTYLDTLYADFPITADEAGHFDIHLLAGHGVRRWIRRQANLIVNGERPFLPLPADLAGALFEWTINYCVGRDAHRFVAMHAAVVERDGRALVISGESGAGKSTLCAALVLDGWRLLSDEFALLDPDTGMLSPLPRPVSLKNASIEIIKKRGRDLVFGPEGIDIEQARFVHMKPPASSVRRASETAVPALAIFPRWRNSASTTLTKVAKAQVLLRLADQSFNYNYLGVRGFEAIAGLARRVEGYELEYSDLDDVLPRLAGLCDARARPA
ncbi:MAG TPA: HprK-related kinase A [Vicinamibacterales bacterium]|nr:HprK-related kinase A [Vicinamibacterales bacterium]